MLHIDTETGICVRFVTLYDFPIERLENDVLYIHRRNNTYIAWYRGRVMTGTSQAQAAKQVGCYRIYDNHTLHLGTLKTYIPAKRKYQRSKADISIDFLLCK